ncbi:alpha/beta hydrolase [Paenibacillus ihuae]|uniref:alpha/beta hydrolase n=1 Tax=Paenibacillus ihuae TaxID=1232431 RepID=UPI0006D53A05|nr:alpha/beta hydrolase-fold protein [Paenibacillus ihuae]
MEGTYRRKEFNGRRLGIYTPMSYGQICRRYPVVYLQDDGEMLEDNFNYLEHLMITKELPELILVGISPHDRNHDYTPWPSPALMSGWRDFGGGGGEYLSELVHSIKPCIDSGYLTLPGSEHTGICGSSFGGIISIYTSYLYPDIFGRIGLISASFWYPGLVEYMRQQAADRRDQRIYMYVGELEGLYKTNIQRQMVPLTRQAHTILQDQGFDERLLRFDTSPEGTHDRAFFSRQFPAALKWMFG